MILDVLGSFLIGPDRIVILDQGKAMAHLKGMILEQGLQSRESLDEAMAKDVPESLRTYFRGNGNKAYGFLIRYLSRLNP